MSEDGFASLGRVLHKMLERAHAVPPDRLSSLGDVAAEVEGLLTIEILLADYGGRRLVSFGAPARTTGAPSPAEDAERSLAIDGTVAGRCFVHGESMEVATERGTILYVPLLDGVDRLGVVQFELEALDDERRHVLEQVAALLAAETVTRGQYTDIVSMTRRLEPLSLPAELQWSLLPPNSFASGAVRVAAALEPAYQVAGDAYDYAYTGGTLRAALFDAMGHDLPATLICGLAVGGYRNERRRGSSLLETARFLDRAIRENVPNSGYATALLVELDGVTGTLSFLNAGHPQPLLLRDGRVVGPLEGGNAFPLGLGDLAAGTDRAPAEARLQPGDRVLLYSDGIVEAYAAGGVGFGVERLTEFVRLHLASGLPDVEVTRRLIHAVVDHDGGRLRDDATVMLVHWRPPDPAGS